MTYLLDTCIISDIARKADAGLLAWASAQRPLDLHLSVLSLAEIQKGIELLPRSVGKERREELREWLQRDLPAQFAGRLLPVDDIVALAYGLIAGLGQRERRPLPVIDGLLLATAETHGLTLVTRNLRDVEGRGVPVFSPYSGARHSGS